MQETLITRNHLKQQKQKFNFIDQGVRDKRDRPEEATVVAKCIQMKTNLE